MAKPLLLDLFCGAGGAAMGYARAGFEVLGVDIKFQKRYPFDFMQRDALTIDPWWAYLKFDAVHASPPCQSYSPLAALHPESDLTLLDLIPQTRELLQAIGKPYIIENVSNSPLHRPIRLCGSMFGLQTKTPESDLTNPLLRPRPKQLRRHRHFECSFPVLPPCRCKHFGESVGVYGTGSGYRIAGGSGGYQGTREEREDAMGIVWMQAYELTQAVPPAYTEHIGRKLLTLLYEG